MPLLFETINYKEHFLVVNFVVLFRRREFTKEKRYEVKILSEVLRERSADSKVEGVGFYINGQHRIEMSKDRRRCETDLQEVKRGLTRDRPHEISRVAFRGVRERFGNF